MGILHWLFGREITQEEAIRIAALFARAEWESYTADEADKLDFPYDCSGAALGGNYWYVRFHRRWPEGVVSSGGHMEIWVHKKTGEADHCDAICNRYFDQLKRDG